MFINGKYNFVYVYKVYDKLNPVNDIVCNLLEMLYSRGNYEDKKDILTTGWLIMSLVLICKQGGGERNFII